MQKCPVCCNPHQFIPDLARRNPPFDFQRVDIDGALATVVQLDVNMRQQVIVGLHQHPRGGKSLQGRHRTKCSATVALYQHRGLLRSATNIFLGRLLARPRGKLVLEGAYAVLKTFDFCGSFL